MANSYNININACNALADLAAAGARIQDNSDSLSGLLAVVGGKIGETANHFVVDSLQAIGNRIKSTERTVIEVGLVCMLNFIQFVSKLEAIRKTSNLRSGTAAMRQEIKNGNLTGFADTQLERWKTSGYKFSALAGAGK